MNKSISKLINKFAKRKATIVENRPGVTKAQQWIKVDKEFELLDTPGVLWPSFEDEKIGTRLALLGTIKEGILPKEELVVRLLSFFKESQFNAINERYGTSISKMDDEQEAFDILEQIGRKRGMLLAGNRVDYDKVISNNTCFSSLSWPHLK